MELRCFPSDRFNYLQVSLVPNNQLAPRVVPMCFSVSHVDRKISSRLQNPRTANTAGHAPSLHSNYSFRLSVSCELKRLLLYLLPLRLAFFRPIVPPKYGRPYITRTARSVLKHIIKNSREYGGLPVAMRLANLLEGVRRHCASRRQARYNGHRSRALIRYTRPVTLITLICSTQKYYTWIRMRFAHDCVSFDLIPFYKCNRTVIFFTYPTSF